MTVPRPLDPDVTQGRDGSWRVTITAGGRRHHIGIYDDRRIATDIARRARHRVGDHPQPYDCCPLCTLPIKTWLDVQARVAEIRAATRTPRPRKPAP